MQRGRIAAGLLALATCVAFIAVTNSAAFANPDAPVAPAAAVAAPIRAAAPVTSTDTADGRTLSSDNAITLTDSGATVTVVGAGFDPATDVYLAICATAATAQNPLTDCLGGAVPAANPTKAWGWVSGDASRPNHVAWTDTGFTASLVISSPDGIGPVCGDGGCVIIARTDGDPATRAADITIPVTFSGDDPTSTSTTTSTTTTTSTSEGPSAPLTVGPQSVVSPEITVGGTQTVVFAQFEPGEQVSLLLFPGPTELPPAQASDVGVVTVSFQIPEGTQAGPHRLQATGVNSGTVGIAEFNVAAAAVTTATTVSTTSSVTSSAETTTSTSASTETTTSETVTTTTSTDAAPIPAGDGESSSLWWLWVTIIVVVLVGGVTGAVALSRRRAAQLAEEEAAKEQELADAADRAAQDRAAGAQPYQPVTPDPYGRAGDDLGLLSGRDHTDGPALYLGQGSYTPEPPTQRIQQPNPQQPNPQQQNPQQHGLAKPRVEPPTTRIPAPGPPPGGGIGPGAGLTGPAAAGLGAAGATPPGDSGPGTAQWVPDFSHEPGEEHSGGPSNQANSEPDSGPATQAWQPPAEPTAEPDSGPATQAWQPPTDPDDDAPRGRHS